MRLSKLLAAALLAAPVLASAASPAQTTFQVRAEVTAACKVTATDIVVAYDPNAAAVTTGTGTISVACTKGTGYNTTLTSGNGWKLNGAAGALDYKIYQGSGTSGTIWADLTTSTPWVVASATSKAAENYVATAAIDANQDVPAGSYTDTVTVNVNY